MSVGAWVLFLAGLCLVGTMADKKAALASLALKIPSHLKIGFRDMKNLMELCQKVDMPNGLDKRYITEGRAALQDTPRGLSTIFSGVFPGTKWCGTGDIAGSYYDIGVEKQVDKCCRTHDLCPVKVAGFKTQYGITNYAPYTRSHCDCDLRFYNCLKKVKSSTADILGNLFFNVGQLTCVEDVSTNTRGAKMTKRFRVIEKRF